MIVLGSTEMDVWYPVDIMEDAGAIILDQYPHGEIIMKVSEFERLIEIYQESKASGSPMQSLESSLDGLQNVGAITAEEQAAILVKDLKKETT